jgi:TatD DNase family protein
MERLSAHPKVVAIGETGLDYHYDYSPRDTQRAVFRRQVELAVRLDLPVIVHTREADADTEAILREVRPTRGVLHCFTSGADLAQAALELGFMISFSGIVTFPKAQDLVAIARTVPSDRLLIETDCPYLAPVPHRGKRNEPAFVSETARFLAGARGVSLDQISEETSQNFARLFSTTRKTA